MVARRSAVAALVAVLLTPSWAAAEPGASQAPSDLQLLRSIQRQVLQYPHYTVFDSIRARIDDGVVTLTGKVTMPDKRKDIEDRVSGVKGVQQVHNRIEVLRASKSDDDLRHAIARAIYGHATFRQYAARVNPPIHILVERGRVTLEGVVADQSERLLAGSLAGRFGSFGLTNDLMTEAEARAELARF
jgi:hyperosmotically inducible protein